MELFDRTKAILLKPKEEWEVIEAESSPHAKVLTVHLLLLAAIPAIIKFVGFWWQWRKIVNNRIKALESSSYGHYGDSMAKQIEKIKDQLSFDAVGFAIQSITASVIIVGSVYIAATIINAVAEKNGAEKNFDRAFSLAAYSFTPLCVAGLLYIYAPLATLVPIVGLYGAYLLYLGITPIMKPAVDKVKGFFVVALIAALGSWFVLNEIVPGITKDIYQDYKVEQVKKLK